MPEEEKSVSRQEFQESIQAVTANLNLLGEVVNANVAALRKSFTIVDGHQHVLRRVVNDVVQECVFTHSRTEFDGSLPVWGDDPSYVALTEEGEVDFVWYYRQYNLCTAVISGFEVLAEKLKKEEPAEVLTPPAQEEIEFGGDYGARTA